LKQALHKGLLDRSERIVLLNTGSGLKSVPSLPQGQEITVSGAAETV
jgi:hypothetical protein